MIIRREIGEKGQVVIPKDIREHLGLNIGVNIIFEVRDNEVVLKKEDDASKIVEDFFNTPKITNKEFIGVTSVLSWDEITFIVKKFLGKGLAEIEGKKFFSLPNFIFVDAKKDIIIKAQKLFEEYNLMPRDAIHAATAIYLNIDEMISEDIDFDKIKELKRINPVNV